MQKVLRVGRASMFVWRSMRPLLALLMLLAAPAFAQGDGPKSQNQIPIDTPFLIPTYIHVSGNYNLAGTIFIPGADVEGDIGALTWMRSFDLGGRYAQFYITPIYGRVDGSLEVTDPVTGAQLRRSIGKSGLLDPVFIFKLGLAGFEPRTLKDIMTKGDPGFQLAASAAVTAPVGEYDSDDMLNLGTNVWSLRLGAPMMIPLSARQQGRVSTHLELMPTITFYADNDDPTGGANRREQAVLYGVESHLLHDFSPRLWGSIDLRYVNGGETTTDGIDDGNRQAALGGGFTLSYAFTPKMSLQGTYGVILHAENEDIERDQFRLKMVIML